MRPFSRQYDNPATQRACLATFTKLKSGSWRAQVRRKENYVNETFLRRKEAEEWALEIKRRIHRGDPTLEQGSRDAKTIGDLIQLHRDDLQAVRKCIARSEAASLTLLEHREGRFWISELDRVGISAVVDFSGIRLARARRLVHKARTSRCDDGPSLAIALDYTGRETGSGRRGRGRARAWRRLERTRGAGLGLALGRHAANHAAGPGGFGRSRGGFRLSAGAQGYGARSDRSPATRLRRRRRQFSRSSGASYLTCQRPDVVARRDSSAPKAHANLYSDQ